MNRNPITKFQKGHIPWNKGKKGLQKHSEKTKRKISELHKGKKLSEEHRKKLSNAIKGKKGKSYFREKNPNWKGGISFEPYSTDWTKTLRRAIRERDRYICQICGKEPAIDVHHIDYDKKNCNPNNLVTLCHTCHLKTYRNRNYWLDYFKDYVSTIFK